MSRFLSVEKIHHAAFALDFNACFLPGRLTSEAYKVQLGTGGKILRKLFKMVLTFEAPILG